MHNSYIQAFDVVGLFWEVFIPPSRLTQRHQRQHQKMQKVRGARLTREHGRNNGKTDSVDPFLLSLFFARGVGSIEKTVDREKWIGRNTAVNTAYNGAEFVLAWKSAASQKK